VLLRVDPSELGASMEALRAEASRVLDHERKLRGFPGRTLVLHAFHDNLVYAHEARANASWAQNAELVLYPRGDHNSIHAYNLDDIVARVAALAGV
jgi:pimeloyl-ACP methyl ester carboxylesterase